MPAAVALSDDDGAADTATLSQAEPVLTETMAELYLKQGHQQDALRVYQALLAQRPTDAKLRRRVEELTGGGARRAGSGVSAQAFLKGIWSGRGSVPTPTREPPPPPPLAPLPQPELAPAAQQSTLEAAFDAADSGMSAPGEPSYPAQDHISLDSVFGDDSTRRSTSTPAAGDGAAAAAPAAGAGGSPGGGSASGGGAAPFSFDDFFGGAGGGAGTGAAAAPAAGAGSGEPSAPVEPGSARTPGRSSGRAPRPPEDEADADQFQQWLKKLKS